MKKFFMSIPTGVRLILAATTVCYITALLLGHYRVCDLYAWLALSPPDVWHGHVWQLLTYWMLPGGWLPYVLNVTFFLMMAPILEKEWSRRELWLFCLVNAVGAGLAKTLIPTAGGMAGMLAINYGLLVAWIKMFRYEKVLFLGRWPASVWTMAVVVVIISLLLSYPCGLINALLSLFGAVSAWIYLTTRWKKNMSGRASAHASERINRLEF